jgi:hypothetical protein
MRHINGHLSSWIITKNVDRIGHIHNVRFSGFGVWRAERGSRIPFFLINFAVLPIKVENVFSCAEFDSYFSSCGFNCPLLLIYEIYEFLSFLRIRIMVYLIRNIIIGFLFLSLNLCL